MSGTEMLPLSVDEMHILREHRLIKTFGFGEISAIIREHKTDLVKATKTLNQSKLK